MTTTPKQVHKWFTGPWVELTIEPGIIVMIGRSREVENAVAIATGTFDARITSFVTIPKDEFIRTITAVQAML
jgi:hypothetical protein